MDNGMPRCIWEKWKLVRLIGRGTYGSVYEALRYDEFGMESRAAIKIISIPQNESDLDTLSSEGLDRDASRAYMKNLVDDFANEVRLMIKLKGVPNIVSVDDYQVIERKEEVGWDIWIRMELLTSLAEYSMDRTMTEEEVAKLGMDLCTALDICAQKNIIHRDIKPGNIFVNEFGDFKLGRFLNRPTDGE